MGDKGRDPAHSFISQGTDAPGPATFPGLLSWHGLLDVVSSGSLGFQGIW